MKPKILIVFVLIAFKALAQSETTTPHTYVKDSLIFQDNFEKKNEIWLTETVTSETSGTAIKNGKLIIDVNCGATVWLNKKLSGNFLIRYERQVIINNGVNDRLSDLNQFWMANDLKNPNLFTRIGTFSQYDDLSMYYFGIGGNRNKTTRFRKYLGTGERKLLKEFTAPDYLLKPNKTYVIETVVYNGTTTVYVNDVEYFSFSDPQPLEQGYFGFRTTQSRHEIDNITIYRLK